MRTNKVVPRTDRRHGVVIAVLVNALWLGLAGCASPPGAPSHLSASDMPPAMTTPVPAGKSVDDDTPPTGSLLIRRHGNDALPITVYDAETQRRQGVTSAAGFLRRLPF